jgi:carbonic anhydrase
MILAATSILVICEGKCGFSFSRQDKWGGLCASGRQQSPIDIVTRKVEHTVDFPLKFNGWKSNYDGDFANTGHTVKFTPRIPGQVTTSTKFGDYTLQQLHMHWGSRKGEGSEHTINGRASVLEIHFAHTKRNLKTPGPAHMTVAVLVEAGKSRSKPWKKLDLADITEYRSSKYVRGFRFDSLLPRKRDYYVYDGSLEIPPCTEDMLWYVMKHKIRVPKRYLQKLRTILDKHQHPITHNFRHTQPLNGRKVFASK